MGQDMAEGDAGDAPPMSELYQAIAEQREGERVRGLLDEIDAIRRRRQEADDAANLQSTTTQQTRTTPPLPTSPTQPRDRNRNRTTKTLQQIRRCPTVTLLQLTHRCRRRNDNKQSPESTNNSQLPTNHVHQRHPSQPKSLQRTRRLQRGDDGALGVPVWSMTPMRRQSLCEKRACGRSLRP
jgi:hypothetical protein